MLLIPVSLGSPGAVYINSSNSDPAPTFTQAAIPDGPFGITNITPSWKEAITYAEARAEYWVTPTGTTWDRWTIDWNRVEFECDQQFTWSFENLDYAVGIPQAHTYALNAVVVLRGVPSCYLDMTAGYFGITGLGNLGESAFDRNGAIKQDNPWARYVYEVSTLYGEYVDAWEIFNEIDHENEWISTVDPETGAVVWHAPQMNTPEGRELYLRLLEVASEVLRHVDKTQNDKIILASPLIGTAVDAATNENWYRRLLRQIAAGESYLQTFDAIALHTYGRPKNTYLAIQGVRWFELLNNKPVWMTETGVVAAGTQETPNYPLYFPTHESCGGANDANHGQPCGDDTEMASYVIQQYVYALYAFAKLGEDEPGKGSSAKVTL